MSTRLLYHAFGLRGYRCVKSEYLGGGVVFTVEPEPKTLNCTACGSPNVVRSGETLRNFHTLPLCTRVGIHYRVQAFDHRTIFPHQPNRRQLQVEIEENTSFIVRSESIQNLVPGE